MPANRTQLIVRFVFSAFVDISLSTTLPAKLCSTPGAGVRGVTVPGLATPKAEEVKRLAISWDIYFHFFILLI